MILTDPDELDQVQPVVERLDLLILHDKVRTLHARFQGYRSGVFDVALLLAKREQAEVVLVAEDVARGLVVLAVAVDEQEERHLTEKNKAHLVVGIEVPDLLFLEDLARADQIVGEDVPGCEKLKVNSLFKKY